MGIDKEAKFKLGRIVVEKESQEVLHPEDVKRALDSHAQGNWGHVDAYDRNWNEQAIMTGASISSLYYDRNDVEFWVTTNGKHTLTVVELAPDFEQDFEPGPQVEAVSERPAPRHEKRQEPLEQLQQEEWTEKPRRPKQMIPERDGPEKKTRHMLVYVD